MTTKIVIQHYWFTKPSMTKVWLVTVGYGHLPRVHSHPETCNIIRKILITECKALEAGDDRRSKPKLQNNRWGSLMALQCRFLAHSSLMGDQGARAAGACLTRSLEDTATIALAFCNAQEAASRHMYNLEVQQDLAVDLESSAGNAQSASVASTSTSQVRQIGSWFTQQLSSITWNKVAETECW